MSVMLRTHWVRWPRSRRRRWRTSYSRKVAAWPTWPPSYGVIPHVYIVTVGPGSNGTTAWRAVSYNRMGIVLDVQPCETDSGPRLVADVDLQQHGREGLDRRRGRERARVARAQAGDLGHHLGRGG